jgi:hypothetical protein
MKDRYVKLTALEKLAKPMKEIHSEEGYDEKGEHDEDEKHECKCPCCGAPCEACGEADDEDESEDAEDEKEDSEDNEEGY